MMSALISLTLLGLLLGLILGMAARIFKVEGNALVEELLDILPGSQCGQCGFPGCTGAAQALASGTAQVTLCPPGGRAVAEALATRLGVSADLSSIKNSVPMVAEVQEEICIGCTRCFKVCPTDAIMGAAQQIHSVFREACTACGKCEAVCPTESIKLRPAPVTLHAWNWHKPAGMAA